MEPPTDNHKITPIWEAKSEFPELRRPTLNSTPNETNTANSNETNAANTNNSNSTTVVDIVQKSTLSVDAEEWYPQNYKTVNQSQVQQQHSVQDRLKKYAHSEKNSNELGNHSQMHPAEHEIDRLNDAIQVLTVKPWKFDYVVLNLLESLEPHFSNVDFVSNITSIIFNQAMKEPNFQYSGARLCAMLDENCPMFRAYLHSLCETELKTTNNLPVLTLLIAEIYSQMSFELFGKCLFQALQKLLHDNTPENVKYVCQTLKLTGFKLEALDEPLMKQILNKLQHYKSPHCPSHLVNLIQSVLTLAQNNWGREDVQAIPPPAEPCNWSDGPVYYGPDGVELTSEETEFLAESLEEFLIDDTDPDELWSPEPEMSEEIQAAFAEFVRSSHR